MHAPEPLSTTTVRIAHLRVRGPLASASEARAVVGAAVARLGDSLNRMDAPARSRPGSPRTLRCTVQAPPGSGPSDLGGAVAQELSRALEEVLHG